VAGQGAGGVVRRAASAVAAHPLPVMVAAFALLPLLPFLVRYGPALLGTLRDAIDGPGWDHRLLTL